MKRLSFILALLFSSYLSFAQSFESIDVSDTYRSYLVSPSTVYIFKTDGYDNYEIWLSTDTGRTFNFRNKCKYGKYNFLSKDSSFYVIHNTRKLLVTTDGWLTNDTFRLDFITKGIKSIFYINNSIYVSYIFNDTNDIWIKGTYFSQDFGKTWNKYSDHPIIQMKIFNNGIGYGFVAEEPNCPNCHPYLVKTNDYGKNWQRTFDFTYSIPSYSNFYFFKDCIIVKGGNIMKSVNEGKSWKIINNGFPQKYYFYDINFIDNKTGFSTGHDKKKYTVYRTFDAGENWYMIDTLPQLYRYISAIKANDSIFIFLENQMAYSDLMIGKFPRSVIYNSIKENKTNDMLLELYPNPVSDVVIIENKNTLDLKISFYNTSGQMILNESVTDKNKKINIESFNPGIYFYIVLDKNQNVITSGKIVKE
jgi:hypothetical protein